MLPNNFNKYAMALECALVRRYPVRPFVCVCVPSSCLTYVFFIDIVPFCEHVNEVGGECFVIKCGKLAKLPIEIMH